MSNAIKVYTDNGIEYVEREHIARVSARLHRSTFALPRKEGDRPSKVYGYRNEFRTDKAEEGPLLLEVAVYHPCADETSGVLWLEGPAAEAFMEAYDLGYAITDLPQPEPIAWVTPEQDAERRKNLADMPF